jgi:hypothetical protein
MKKHIKSALIDNAERLQESSQNEATFNVSYPESLTVFLPECLDLEKIVRENPPKDIPAFHIDNLKYILHLISYIPSKKKDYDYGLNNGYVPINKQKIQKSGIYHYRKYLDYLIQSGVIYEDAQYIKGAKSRGICFPLEYQYCKVKKDKITKKNIIKAVINNSIAINNQIVTEKLPYLAKWWNEDGLKIAYEPALIFLHERFENSKKELKIKFNLADKKQLVELLEKEKLKKKRERKLKNPYEQYNSALQVVERLHEKRYLMKIDTTSGRLHTLLTQLPKNLRQFVTFRGKKLVSIDLRNSQPLLAITLLSKDLILSNPILINTITKYNPTYQIKSPSTMLVLPIYNRQNKPDVLNYIKIVSEGRYYEEFGRILKNRGLIPDDVEDVRKFAKRATYASFFSSNLHTGFIEATQHFKKTFPNVYFIFLRIKYNPKGVKVKEKYHRALAVTLQAFEAELFLHKISKRISEISSDIPIFTIHDSVVTTLEYQQIVEEVVKDEVCKAIEISSVLNIEEW